MAQQGGQTPFSFTPIPTCKPCKQAPASKDSKHGIAYKKANRMISIENLTKRYGETTACDIPALTIPDGEIVGLVGNNGAGKTTLFRLMLDLAKADTGQITTTPPRNAGTTAQLHTPINVAKSESWKPFTGAYLNESFLIDYLTPEEYFDFLAKISGVESSEMAQRLTRFDTFANGEVLGQGKLIRDLSAGNRQKVGIMAALAGCPSVVILDEPFNFLDPQSQNHLKKLLTQYNKENGATILISSHNLAHTIDISTRIILLESGRIIRDIPNNGEAAAQELDKYFGAE